MSSTQTTNELAEVVEERNELQKNFAAAEQQIQNYEEGTRKRRLPDWCYMFPIYPSSRLLIPEERQHFRLYNLNKNLREIMNVFSESSATSASVTKKLKPDSETTDNNLQETSYSEVENDKSQDQKKLALGRIFGKKCSKRPK